MKTKVSKTNLFLSIPSIVLGILFFIIPNQVLNIMFYIIGGLIILFALYRIIRLFINHKNELSEYCNVLFFYIILLLVGVTFETIAIIFVYVFIIIFAISIIIFGAYRIYALYLRRSLSLSNRIINTLLNSLIVLIGILLIANIGGTINVLMYVLGSLFIVCGIIELLTYIKEYKEAKKENDNIIDL